MKLVRETKLFELLILLSYFCLESGTAPDTITTTKFINDPETLISSNGNFKLGFFSPANSTYRYVGIWYAKFPASSIIWVANRNKPLKTSSGILTMSEDGNLVVLDEQEKIIWSSNITDSVFNTTAQLLDSGNLVLLEKKNGTIIWESFQHPADALVPKMKVSTNVRTGQKVQLTSWTNQSDPSTGTFSAGIDVFNLPEISIWNGSRRYWRSGPWNSRVFIGIPSMDSVFLDGFSLIDDQEGTFYFSFAFSNDSILSNFVLNAQGNIVQNYSNNGDNWEVRWLALKTECDVYGKCGAFGICNSNSLPICNCLVGFEPKNTEEWNRGNWTSGCVRTTPLQCERVTTDGEERKKDEFLKLKMMKVPYFINRSYTFEIEEDECRDQCLENCSCIAYAYDAGIGCMSWTRDLIDLQKFSIDGVDLYVRLADSELDTKGVDVKVVITITTTIGTLFVAICTFSLWLCMAKRKARKRKTKEALAYAKFPGESKPEQDSMTNQVKLLELPIFSLEELASATNNFHQSNKLGQGGFGPVYRGKLLQGQEIAVKRLSRASGQGLEEFMNEVVVISKLQHRNLVRLLGGCVEGEEKLLIYEYMPNKSLDVILFDPSKQELVLDWRQRFQIIEGIGRGLLYLHRDSRLRIIHRDLKASNILLDEDLNPKISDFGMARIFGGNEDQANTNRVVGTYGYMSPEYAMEGRFSEKSDIFSFGVLLLEIVSGRRNTSFYHDEQAMSLLEFVWKMWNANKIAALVDPKISEPCFEVEILRCIHVGLLCVQDFAKDRPTVSIAISMLKSEIVNLPRPKQPAFTATQIATETTTSQCNKSGCSINNVTVTMVQGR
ncbi:G-type lectin S-receptor-like serine/threonine-protein kinase At1g11330 [Juglans microcarpa x Juglans regia]|uniref:G-type lectin S-receptor-like serine/threonine-protein kinase At1g11330 n=1 Tax=Juglans microcarpa x Juglans regia TaxID=2249226 RepID=UPI001B7DB6F7|nr:G-type lectin S-receptor-like serine/threonine-protein kinase At1g11330 [Juglans microcarpa x Juglans regia]